MKPGSSDGILTVLASLLVAALLFVAQRFTGTNNGFSTSSPDHRSAATDTGELNDSSDSSTWVRDPVGSVSDWLSSSTNRTASTDRTSTNDAPFHLPENATSTTSPPLTPPSRLPGRSAATTDPLAPLPPASGRPGGQSTRTFNAQPSESAAAASRNSEPNSPTSSPAANTYKVVKVIDGDTVDLLVNLQPVRLRLNGIDTPEKGQPFGNAAKDALAKAVGGKHVEYVVQETDRYGRSIADIYYRGVHINKWLLQQGLAWHYKAYNNDPDLARTEQEAAAARRGLWADPRKVAPWNWRKLSKVERDQYR